MSEAPEVLRRPETSVTIRGSSPSSSGGLKQMGIMLIIAIVVCFAMVQFVFLPSLVSKKDFTANLASVTDALTVIKNSQKGDEGTLSTVSSQVSSFGKQIQDIQASNSALSKTVDGYKTQLSNLPSAADVTAIQSALTALTSKVNTLPNTDYATQIADLKTQIKTLTDKVTALGNGTGTGTGTGDTTGTTTNGNLTVTLQSGWGGSNPIMSFAGLSTANTTDDTVQTSTFSYRLTNNSTTTAKNIQLNIGLAFLNATATSTMSVPNGVTVSISLISSPMTNWTKVYTGASMIGYSNTAPVIGTLGSISQVSGTSPVQTVTVTITIAKNSTAPAFNLYPTVEVASYS
jgi:hypothetical protein